MPISEVKDGEREKLKMKGSRLLIPVNSWIEQLLRQCVCGWNLLVLKDYF